jgi:Domain of unknown function (DUF222)/HNH endonuclease
MDSNTHSTAVPAGLTRLADAVDELDTQPLDGLADSVLADRVKYLRWLAERLEGRWLGELAVVDSRGAAGAEDGIQAPSTASWLRTRCRMGAGAAHRAVRTARAVFGGPLTHTAQALTAGTISPAHAAVLADGTHDLHAHTITEAEPVLLNLARQLDPPRLRRAITHLRLVADPDGEQDRAEQRHGRRGLWLSPTFEGMVALQGLLEPEAGQTLLAALEPLARPANAEDTRSASQRRADALAELARRTLEAGRLPQTGGVRPQLLVTVDLDTLLGRPGAIGGEGGWTGPLDPEACQRLACDGAVTRVLVSRHPNQHAPDHPDHDHGRCGNDKVEVTDPDRADLAARLRHARTRLPPTLGGAPSQPLDLGRTTRVIHPTQRAALVVRDGGCVFPGCDRPQAWCEAHHLVHWLDGGPTDLPNLALLCRAHHRAVHEGGWRLGRDPDGQLTTTPPHRRPRHRHHHPAA